MRRRLTEGDAEALGEYAAMGWYYGQGLIDDTLVIPSSDWGSCEELAATALDDAIPTLDRLVRRDEGRDPSEGELEAFSSQFRKIATWFAFTGWAPLQN